MPALLFHQNMRRFGGGAPARVQAYAGIPPAPGLLPDSWPWVCPAHNAFGFPAIAAAVQQAFGPPGLTFCAIGLTEISNDRTALHATAALSHVLSGGGHGRTYRFNCGATALGGPEYTMISVSDWVRVLALGRVVPGAGPDGNEVEAPPFSPERWSALPAGASADWRFVVYAVLQMPGGAPFAVGFLHNTYTLDSKASIALGLPFVVERIWENHVATPQHVFLGGDFNVEPHRPDTRRPLYVHEAVTDASTPRIFGGTLGGTTWHGSRYDYWLSDLPRGTPNMEAGLYTATWDGPSGLMSDHVAIMLRIA